MKKRVLSVLLAVIMLVSAVPMVLPTFAATENEFTEADYNALYVQNGLEMGADFFRTNQYWGGAVVQPPVGPAANTAYPWDVNGDGVVSDGETIDLTDPENRVTEDGSSRSAAFAAAQADWVTAHNAYMNAFVWTSGSMNFLTFTRTEVKYLPYEQSPVIMHEGYVQMGKVHNQNGGIGFNNDGAPAGSTAATAQTILGFDSANTGYVGEHVLVMFHDLRVSFMKNAGADAYTMKNAIARAIRFAEGGIVGKISDNVELMKVSGGAAE